MANGLSFLINKGKDSNAPATPVTPAADTAESGPVQGEAADSAPQPSSPSNPFARFAATEPAPESGPSADGDSVPADSGSTGGDTPKLAGLSLNLKQPVAQVADSPKVDMAGIAKLGLSALSESEDEGIAPVVKHRHTFDDETPATKPTRELPADLTKEALGFMDMVDSVYDVLHEPEFLGGIIKNILIELKANPEYMKLVAPDDVRQWIKGIRDSMGLAKIRKIETKTKKSTTSRSKKVDADMMADLADLGLDKLLD
jgi:hypothetical protein